MSFLLIKMITISMVVAMMKVQMPQCLAQHDVHDTNARPFDAGQDDDAIDDKDDSVGGHDPCAMHTEPTVRRVLGMCTDFMWKSLRMQPHSSISSSCLVPGQIIDMRTAVMLAEACRLATEGSPNKCNTEKTQGSSNSNSIDNSSSCDSSRGSSDDRDNIDEGGSSNRSATEAEGGRSVGDDESSDSHDSRSQRTFRRSKRALASSLPAYKWTLPVQYRFRLDQSGAIDVERVKAEVRRAMAVIQSDSCVTFAETYSGAQLMLYTSSSCASYTGRRTNDDVNSIFLGPTCQYSAGQILHLLVQTLGFFNEHQRSDRDEFVSVNSNNISPTRLDAFITMPGTIATTFDLPYDYYSIMQQPQKFLSANGGPTLETKDSSYQIGLGQRVELSFLDKVAVNKMYCSGSKYENRRK